jgi:hypothetical protein
MSSYDIINQSILYYRLNGFQYVDVPWLVDEDISNITKPNDKQNFYVNSKCLVASGEQSFLQFIIDNKLTPGEYSTCTPCFRDEIEDCLHKKYFMKTELIKWDFISNDESINMKQLKNIIQLCYDFFSKYVPVTVLTLEDGSFDIVDVKNNIELGSYGFREFKNIKWIYATGCAAERLIYVIHLNKKSGYHKEIIPKYEVGTYGKILEETSEFVDALLQNNKIMTLVELSDLYGAIDLYLKKNYVNIGMKDIKKMSKLTQTAFLNGRRN